jgi:hypothetical protein
MISLQVTGSLLMIENRLNRSWGFFYPFMQGLPGPAHDDLIIYFIIGLPKFDLANPLVAIPEKVDQSLELTLRFIDVGRHWALKLCYLGRISGIPDCSFFIFQLNI